MSILAHCLAASRAVVGDVVRALAPPSPAARRVAAGAACLYAAALTGCVTPPAEYAAALAPHDPKWQSPECNEMRTAAMTYEAGRKKPMSWTTGLLLGPYGLGIAVAGREHQEKQRKLFVREMHLACSSRPLPRELQFDPDALMASQG